MIKIEDIDVDGWRAAIRGMRNPMNSWEKSDTIFDGDKWCLGNNDLKLMQQLSTAGDDDSKFLRMIVVTMDITAPLYWWKEFDTYKVGTVANSCSTMHKIADKEFTVDDFSHEHLDGVSRDMFYQNDRNQPYFFCSFEDILYIQIEALNRARNLYLETKTKPMKEEAKRAPLMKKYWWQMIQLLPSSYNQKRTVLLNYQVLKNMYFARRNHKLDEWRTFCEEVKKLPCFEEACIEPVSYKHS
jgi:hypothetical protein